MTTHDEAGFDEFVAARSAALSRTAYLLTGDHHLAQDLVQAALMQAVKHWRRIHTSPEAYVRRAMYHQNISWWRRRRITETSLLSYDGAVPAADTDLRLTLDHRIADATTPLPVDDDLWQRGHTARRRGQAFAVAAVLALVVAVGGVATLVTGTDREARTASTEVVEGGAIPSDIVDVPDDLPVTTDLAVGRGSAAFISSSGDPVVITATDGLPHLLDLPGWDQAPIALALSGDGRRIAYQDASAESGTYVTVVDLETGRSVQAFADDSQRLMVNELSWSPDGRWLAWIATTQDGLLALLGRVDTSDARPRQVRLPSGGVDVAIADDGSALVGQATGGLLMAEPDRTPSASTPVRGSGRAPSPPMAARSRSGRPSTRRRTPGTRTPASSWSTRSPRTRSGRSSSAPSAGSTTDCRCCWRRTPEGTPASSWSPPPRWARPARGAAPWAASTPTSSTRSASPST